MTPEKLVIVGGCNERRMMVYCVIQQTMRSVGDHLRGGDAMIREMLTRKEVEKALRVSRLTVYKMIERGDLGAVKIMNHWRFPVDEIERLQRGERHAV
jgi:excisionase family DNA binding protein